MYNVRVGFHRGEWVVTDPQSAEESRLHQDPLTHIERRGASSTKGTDPPARGFERLCAPLQSSKLLRGHRRFQNPADTATA
jgi:hypothetical protein